MQRIALVLVLATICGFAWADPQEPGESMEWKRHVRESCINFPVPLQDACQKKELAELSVPLTAEELQLARAAATELYAICEKKNLNDLISCVESRQQRAGVPFRIRKDVAPLVKGLFWAAKQEVASAREKETQSAILKCKRLGFDFGAVKIGMSDRHARECGWGDPLSINRTITSTGTHEQWVFGVKGFLYFQGGKLVAIQD